MSKRYRKENEYYGFCESEDGSDDGDTYFIHTDKKEKMKKLINSNKELNR